LHGHATRPRAAASQPRHDAALSLRLAHPLLQGAEALRRCAEALRQGAALRIVRIISNLYRLRKFLLQKSITFAVMAISIAKAMPKPTQKQSKQKGTSCQ